MTSGDERLLELLYNGLAELKEEASGYNSISPSKMCDMLKRHVYNVAFAMRMAYECGLNEISSAPLHGRVELFVWNRISKSHRLASCRKIDGIWQEFVGVSERMVELYRPLPDSFEILGYVELPF